MPLRNQELAKLVGKTCVAIVYDSDIGMNYEPIFANLQGERYGKWTFKIEALEIAGSLPTSKSSTSLYDFWYRVLPPEDGGAAFPVFIHDHEPDAIEINKARYSDSKQKLVIKGESDLSTGPTEMTVSIAGPNDDDPFEAHFVVELPMNYIGGGKFKIVINTPEDLDGRRVSIQTWHGGSYNAFIR
jgi:hypothetical protein